MFDNQIARTFISIHAPRTGSDQLVADNGAEEVLISIHAPRTGSDDDPFDMVERIEISIHAPRTGSDARVRRDSANRQISIHAPRTGSDVCKYKGFSFYGHFNPRSPHGERLQRRDYMMHPRHFNPRSPHGERQDVEFLDSAKQDISIHAPRTGSDRNTGECPSVARISIHAPRTGSDASVR